MFRKKKNINESTWPPHQSANLWSKVCLINVGNSTQMEEMFLYPMFRDGGYMYYIGAIYSILVQIWTSTHDIVYIYIICIHIWLHVDFIYRYMHILTHLLGCAGFQLSYEKHWYIVLLILRHPLAPPSWLRSESVIRFWTYKLQDCKRVQHTCEKTKKWSLNIWLEKGWNRNINLETNNCGVFQHAASY